MIVPSIKRQVGELFRYPLYRNAFFIAASGLIGAPLGFVFWVVAARFYTPADIGTANALMAAIGLVTVLSDLGFGSGITRFLPQERDKSGMINSYFTVTLLLSLVFVLVFIAGLTIWSPKLTFLYQQGRLLFAFIFFAAITVLLQSVSNVFIALRVAKYRFVQELLRSALRLGLAIPFAVFGFQGLFVSSGIATAAAFLVMLAILLITLRGYRLFPTIRIGLIAPMAPFSMAMYVVWIASILPDYILPLMVINLLGAEMNAYFYAAWLFASGATWIANGVGRSLFVEGSHEPERFRSHALRAIKLMFALLIPIAGLLIFFPDKFLLLFGQDYSQNGAGLLRLLALVPLFRSVVVVYYVSKQIQQRMRIVVCLNIMWTVIVLGASALLIPLMGLMGAGVAFIAAHLFVTLVIGWRVLVIEK